MDEFIRIAQKNEILLGRCRETISEAGYEDHDHGLMNDIDEATGP